MHRNMFLFTYFTSLYQIEVPSQLGCKTHTKNTEKLFVICDEDFA